MLRYALGKSGTGGAPEFSLAMAIILIHSLHQRGGRRKRDTSF
jgi:hypothetical protein